MSGILLDEQPSCNNRGECVTCSRIAYAARGWRSARTKAALWTTLATAVSGASGGAEVAVCLGGRVSDLWRTAESIVVNVIERLDAEVYVFVPERQFNDPLAHEGLDMLRANLGHSALLTVEAFDEDSEATTVVSQLRAAGLLDLLLSIGGNWLGGLPINSTRLGGQRRFSIRVRLAARTPASSTYGKYEE